ncbi:MAG TPA: CUB domain-containing protein, partial [Flavobacteriales bacterium]|nr:CUB domain-containing protein [Flavobacteriales bacterium]
NIFVYETPPPAGATGNYGNNVSSTQTFCANAGQLLTVTFDQFQVENQWDKLYVFDGPTTASPMIPSGNGPGLGPAPFGAGGYWGNALPGPFTVGPSPNGCLTFHFVTDPSVTFPGFRARTSCVTQAPNDNPCTPTGATLITPSPICNLQSYTNAGTTNTPGVPAPGCGNYAGGDVWFRFVAPPSGRVYIDTRAGTLTDAAMALYSAASCSGPFTL